MKNEVDTIYNRDVIDTPEQLFTLTGEVCSRGELVCVFTDLDDTVLIGKDPEDGFASGDDPRQVEIVPTAAQAFRDISDAGAVIGVITNRGGRDAANYLRTSGVPKANIMGTYGWERYTMDPDNPALDSIQIDDRFKKHASVITDTLTVLRNRVYEAFGQPILDDGANILIPTKKNGIGLHDQSPIIIQQKGVSVPDGFPLGLANIYNFNLMPQEVGLRDQLKTLLEGAYKSVDELKDLWGMGGDVSLPENVLRFTRGFEPLIKEGKAHAMVTMIREIETAQKKDGSGKKIGLMVFSGDSNADGEAMKAARLLEVIRKGEMRSVGVCVMGNNEQLQVHMRSDIQVKGPVENAYLLHGIASALRGN